MCVYIYIHIVHSIFALPNPRNTNGFSAQPGLYVLNLTPFHVTVTPKPGSKHSTRGLEDRNRWKTGGLIYPRLGKIAVNHFVISYIQRKQIYCKQKYGETYNVI